MSSAPLLDRAAATRPRSGERCPSCASDALSIFYEQEAVPVHSCRLVPTLEEALSFPRGSLRLAFCADCGFITNTLFDATVQDYALSYEETQGFSPRFRSFAHNLAQRWIEKYDLYERDILEIGCGKGEFLVMLCELGRNRGLGIDPAFMEERVESKAASRLTFINDLYDERYVELRVDAVVCRHTLEHISPVEHFLALVRRSIGDRLDAVVLFELPDVGRVLREGAFWDVYYEHCSYFSPGSLARLFRRAGFEVLDLALDYEDQYILIEARAAHGAPRRPLPLEEIPSQLAAEVKRFSSEVAAATRRWQELLRGTRETGRRAVLWGAGSKAVAFLTAVGGEEAIEYAVDVNPYKQGMYIAGAGQAVVAPEFLREYQPDVVIAMNPIYREEIRSQLEGLNVSASVVAV